MKTGIRPAVASRVEFVMMKQTRLLIYSSSEEACSDDNMSQNVLRYSRGYCHLRILVRVSHGRPGARRSVGLLYPANEPSWGVAVASVGRAIEEDLSDA